MELPYESEHRGRAGCEHVERGHDADEGREARVEVSHLWNRMAAGWQSDAISDHRGRTGMQTALELWNRVVGSGYLRCTGCDEGDKHVPQVDGH